MADTIQCACGHCHAKYRLPAEFAGRTGKCKKCGQKFQIPSNERSLEDSVLDWLAEEDDVEEPIDRPRVINDTPEKPASSHGGNRNKGPIRMKTPARGEAAT